MTALTWVSSPHSPTQSTLTTEPIQDDPPSSYNDHSSNIRSLWAQKFSAYVLQILQSYTFGLILYGYELGQVANNTVMPSYQERLIIGIVCNIDGRNFSSF